MIKKIVIVLLVFVTLKSNAQGVKHIRFGSADTPLSGLTITWRSPGTLDLIQWGYTTAYEKGQFSGSIRTNYTENQFDYLFPSPVTANAMIYYKIYDSQSSLWTSQKSFKTSSDPSSNKFNFTALGDSRTYYSDWQRIGNCAAATSSDFVLFAGDLIDDGSISSYYDTWFDYGANFLSKKLFYYTIGNHENTASVQGLANYMGLFTMPGNKEYYSFIHGNALFLVLNSEKPGNAAQLSWLQSTLAANSDKTWKFVLFHKPFFTSPEHVGEMDGYFSTLWKAFDDYGVDLIFNGHTHNYQRSKPINRNISTTSPVADYGSNPGQGRCEVVTGAAGAPLAGLSVPSWWLETTKSELNYCDIAIDGTTLTFRAFSSSQIVLDQFQIVKSAPIPLGGITIYPSALSLPGGVTSQFSAVFTPSNCTNKLVTWASSAPSVATVNSLGFVTGVSQGSATITATTVDGGFTSTCAVSCTSPAIIVGTGNSWKYLDNGSDQGMAWKAPGFNDVTWATGASPLGYGAITNITFGTGNLTPSKITYYLRKNFNYTLTGNETAYQIRVMIDDGCIIYFNGIEVYRNRLSDPVNYLTLAGNEAAEGTYYMATLPLSAVLNGQNIIAVEAHNTSTSSSDLGFDLNLTPVLSTPHNFKALITVFLEGSYNAGSGTMNTSLIPGGLVPLNQPYSSAPWNYGGDEHVDAIPSGIVDWVLVELRQAATPSAALSSTVLPGWPKACFLKSNGIIVDPDGTSLLSIGNPELSGNLYVIIRHRNHVAIMSSSGMSLLGDCYVYDFTDRISKAYGGSAGYKQIANMVCGMVAGDIDGDGQVYVSDRTVWVMNSGTYGRYNAADLDFDGNVYVSDRSIWVTNSGVSNPILKSNQLLEGSAGLQPKYSSQIP